jgi:hypothetical protein
MAINFPNSPTNGQIFTSGGRSYEYNSAAGVWNRKEQTAATIPSDISDLTDTGGVLGTGGAAVYADMAALIAATGMSNGDFGLVAANNNIYVYNGAGWYKIATVQNDSPSAITGVNGTYELAIDGTATTITAVSTDPEGFPLTWSYSASGLGNIATVSNTDNVFTITPSTTEADAGTFTLTINATDGVNGAVSTSTNLTLNFIVTVTNSKYTTLLATATGTSDNNNITDSSTNNHTPTLINPTDALAQGSFSPYRSGGYSTRFLASLSNYVRASSAPTLGNGAWTVECWVYFDAAPISNKHIFGQNNWTGNSSHWAFFADSTKQIRFSYGSGAISVSNNVIADRTWHHICATRDTNDLITLYVDGGSVGTAAGITNNFTYNDMMIGGNSNGQYSNVKIRDCRMVVGSVITPPIGGPTEPLTAVPNTVFLALHKPYLSYDTNSTTDNVFSNISGDIFTEAFSPYDYLEYDAADGGGSIQSTNSNDTSSGRTGLSFADHADFDLAGSDWTFEWWAYVPKSEGVTNLNFINKGPQGAVRPYSFNYRLESGQPGWEPRMFGSSNGSSQWEGYSGAAWQPWSTWTHVAFVRNGSTITRYINGKAYGTGSGDVFDNNEVLYVGGSGDEQPHTHSDLRISKSAVYTAEFTPPTAPLSSTGSVLHLKGTDASIIDKSQNSNLSLHGNTTGSTTQVKFANTKSMYFDGNDGITATGVRIPTNQYKSWTLEAWVYATTSDANTERQIFSQYDGDTFDNRFLFGHAGGAYRVFNGGNSVTSGSGVIQFNSWQHVAATYEGSTASANFGKYTLWVDGNSQGSVLINRPANNSDLQIGSRNQGQSQAWLGYIQDARLTVGLQRYTANFTPPTAPLEG